MNIKRVSIIYNALILLTYCVATFAILYTVLVVPSQKTIAQNLKMYRKQGTKQSESLNFPNKEKIRSLELFSSEKKTASKGRST